LNKCSIGLPAGWFFGKMIIGKMIKNNCESSTRIKTYYGPLFSTIVQPLRGFFPVSNWVCMKRCDALSWSIKFHSIPKNIDQQNFRKPKVRRTLKIAKCKITEIAFQSFSPWNSVRSATPCQKNEISV
jgi:hypothetical protein